MSDRRSVLMNPHNAQWPVFKSETRLLLFINGKQVSAPATNRLPAQQAQPLKRAGVELDPYCSDVTGVTLARSRAATPRLLPGALMLLSLPRLSFCFGPHHKASAMPLSAQR